MFFVVYLGFLATLCSAVPPCVENFYPDNSTPTVCYLFNETEVTWEEAQKSCNQLSPPANLLKFNTDNETDNFFKLYHSLSVPKSVRWLGLKRNCGSPPLNKSSFEWIDGTSTANLHQFPFGGTVDNYAFMDYAEETCYVSSGYWDGGDNNCINKKPFICQYRIIQNNTVIPVNVPYCPLPSTGLVCPTGWARHSLAPNVCFKFFEIHTTNWAEAAQMCQNLGDNITLPILRNENEQMALMNLTSECIHSQDGSGTETWLGLTYNSKFTWMDKMGYSYNNNMTIGAIDHQCGITSNTSSNMIWKTAPCDSSNGGPIQFGRVTCQRRLSRAAPISVTTTCALSAPSGPPPINCAVNPPYLSLTSNDDNDLLYDKDDRVYTLHSWATNWTSAMDFCNKLGSYLARPQKMSELTQLLNFTSNALFWIGARLNVGDGLAYFYNTKNNKSSRMNWWPNGNLFFNPTNQTGANLNQPCYYYDDPSKLKFDNCNVAKGFVCEKIKANCSSSPGTIPYGSITTTCENGQIVYYTCINDYYVVDNNPRVCNKNGTYNDWLTKVPDCYKYCKNDTLLFDSTKSNVSFDTPTGLLDIYSTGTLHCKDGSCPVPANQSTVSHCGPNGIWENLPNCSDYEWNEWQPWTQCSVTCGGGIRSMIRTKKVIEKNDGYCDQNSSVVQICNNITCQPVLVDKISTVSTVQEAIPYLASNLNNSIKRELGYQLRDIISNCSFDGMACKDEDFQQIYDSTYGNCYTFNSGQNPKISYQAGRFHGLQILMKVSQSDYLCSSESAGLKVVIHSSNETTFPDSQGYKLSPGIDNSITVRKYEIHRNSDHNACIDVYSAPLIFGKFYSAEGCFRKCFQQSVEDKCGCCDPRYDILPNSIYCTIEKKTCVDGFRACESSFSGSSCNCHDVCNDVSFASVLTKAKFNVNAYADLYCKDLDNFDNCTSTIENDLVMLNVYIEKMLFVKYTEELSYDFVRLVSDISNVLGILLGFGALTTFEFGYFVINVLIVLSTNGKVKLDSEI